MNVALLVWYILVVVGLLINANQHGKAKTGRHNFWVSVIATSITLVMVWWMLGWQIIP